MRVYKEMIRGEEIPEKWCTQKELNFQPSDPKSTSPGKALIVPVFPIAGHCVSDACTYFNGVVLLQGAVALPGMIGSHVAGDSILAKRLIKILPPWAPAVTEVRTELQAVGND